ncbi:MAG: hypothetical protein B1H07_00175 [Campylobacteraceae bacterium 4484_166]|nr:MAG: hypothetical protein B1H07_00175 [Campylobacteraceae bacterium 4484_166]
MRLIFGTLIFMLFFTGCQQKLYNLEFDKTKKIKKDKIKKDETKKIKKEQSNEDGVQDGPNELFDESGETKVPFSKNDTIQYKDIDEVRSVLLLYSSNTIGKYAKIASSSALGYALSSKTPFLIDTIDMSTESLPSINKALTKAKQYGHKDIIAIITNKSYQNLINADFADDFNIFLPIINKNNISEIRDNFTYGGLDYKKQLQLLTDKINGESSEFYDRSSLGFLLHKSLINSGGNLKFSRIIEQKDNSVRNIIAKNRHNLNSSNLFLNTNLIRTSMILSTLKGTRVKTKRSLSTQINYSPLLLTLVRPSDRSNLFITNSIKDIDPKITENILLLGGKVRFNWIGFATVVGVDHFMNQDGEKIEPNIVENQVLYGIDIYKTKDGAFVRR